MWFHFNPRFPNAPYASSSSTVHASFSTIFNHTTCFGRSTFYLPSSLDAIQKAAYLHILSDVRFCVSSVKKSRALLSNFTTSWHAQRKFLRFVFPISFPLSGFSFFKTLIGPKCCWLAALRWEREEVDFTSNVCFLPVEAVAWYYCAMSGGLGASSDCTLATCWIRLGYAGVGNFCLLDPNAH